MFNSMKLLATPNASLPGTTSAHTRNCFCQAIAMKTGSLLLLIRLPSCHNIIILDGFFSFTLRTCIQPLQGPCDMHNWFSLCAVKKGGKVELLVSLSSIYQTSIDDLRETMDKVNNLITGKLKKKPCLASECGQRTWTTSTQMV